jgi:hypothetical protein
MTNKDMVPHPGPGPAPHDRAKPKEEGKKIPEAGQVAPAPEIDPPDSPQLKPSQDRK